MSKFINGETNYSEWRDHARDNKRYLERMALISLGCKTLLDEIRLVQAVNVSAMSGKLEGFWSVSTSVLMNPICQQRAKDPNSICHHWTTNDYGRIESFGDVASIICARNYLRIIRSHPHIKFGVWTKNVNIWMHAFELEGGKPENMKFIVSSPYTNHPVDIPEEWMPVVDHRFTVYTKEYAEEHGIEINCGGRKCATCMNCYINGPFDIAELMK